MPLGTFSKLTLPFHYLPLACILGVVDAALIPFATLVSNFPLFLQIVYGKVKDSFGGHWMNE